MKFKPGIARAKDGQPLASLEVVVVVNLPNATNPDGNNITVRGLTPAGWEMRDGLHISSGRMFQTGRREVVVGKAVADRYPDAALGKLRSAAATGRSWAFLTPARAQPKAKSSST